MQFQGPTAKVVGKADGDLLGGESLEREPLHTQELVRPRVAHHQEPGALLWLRVVRD